MAAREDDSDLFMSVRLDDCGRICNVVVTSQTTGKDVVECLKPDDDKVYYLVEIWKGCERPISNEEKLKSVLLQWGSDIDDVVFTLKRKHALSRQSHQQKKTASPRSSPVHVEDHVNEQKMKVKSMEKELHEKEQYLKALRAKDGTKNGLKTKYIRHLELKVLEQEEQLKSLRSLESELFNYRVENEKLVLELQKLRSMFALKHQQLSDATARVDWLTTQLAQTNKGEDVRENFGVPTTRMPKEETSMGMQSDVQHQRGLSDQHSSHLAGQHQGSRLTEEQLLRLQANMLRNKAAMMAKQRSSSAGNCVNLEHVILHDNDELGSLLSWQDDEENDTETSADSGHVSVDHDSPSYCNGGVGARFQFNANLPRKYFGKVECFDMDEDFRSQTHGKHLRKDDNTGDDASYQLHNSVYHGSDRRFSRTQPNYTRPLFVQTNMEHTARGMLPFMKTQSIHDSPQSTSSLSSQSSVANSDGEAGGGSSLKASSRKRTNSFPNRDASRSALSSKKVQLSVKQTNTKTDVLEVNPDRTLGSISHYQRNKDDSESPVPKERLAPGRPDPRIEVTGVTQYRVSDSKFEANPPATNPPTKDCLNARSKHFTVEGHLSPRVTESTEDTPLGIAKSRKGRTPVVKQPVSSPGVQDLLDEIPSLKVTTRELKPVQIQTRAEKDSEKSDRTLLVNTESKTTPVQSPSHELKITPDDKSREFARVAPRPVPRKRPKKPPVRNFGDGVNVVLTSSTTVNEPVTTSTEDSTISNDTRSQDKNPSCVSHEESKRGKPGEHRPATKDVPDGAAAVAGESSLRKKGPQGGKKSGKRVSLDPHAVLLHASLEGELDLVKNIIHQVEDPSYPNTEGLTALHNSVCNSHDDIVKFLVEYGCDINAADMQGWTSLHCAAANNSVEICKFLVTHGACVFAVTAIEGKTPSRCCEKDADNFQQCFSYLSDLENNFGVSNDGVVYAVYAYQANRKDELSFECGERLTIIRRGDVTEKEWWWARDSRNQLGYVPRNLLGLSPRVAPDV